MAKYLESFCFQGHAQQPSQTPIMHAAAAHRHLRYACGRVSLYRGLHKARCHPGMKARGYSA